MTESAPSAGGSDAKRADLIAIPRPTLAWLGRLLLGLWAVAATAYVAIDRWEHFKSGALAEAIDGARVDTIQRVIREAERCQAFEISAGDRRSQLIGVQCLQQPAAPALPPNLPPPGKTAPK